MPAAAKGVKDLRSHRLTKASLFFEDTLRGNAIFFLTRKGSCCLDASKRNSNGNADASKGSEATKAFLLPSSEINREVYDSEVYNTDERAR